MEFHYKSQKRFFAWCAVCLFASGAVASAIIAISIATQNPYILLGELLPVFTIYSAYDWTRYFSDEEFIYGDLEK
jgi:hypothetical protein